MFFLHIVKKFDTVGLAQGFAGRQNGEAGLRETLGASKESFFRVTK